MLIIIGGWQRKIFKFISITVLIVAFIVAVSMLAGKVSQQIPVFNDWFAERHPSGNPLRVEHNDATGNKFDQVLDQMVIKMQDFYKEDGEDKIKP